jgi:hypothetical protein
MNEKTRLQKIRQLWDEILEVEEQIKNGKEIIKAHRERRESLLLQVKETVYNPQAQLDFDGEAE